MTSRPTVSRGRPGSCAAPGGAPRSSGQLPPPPGSRQRSSLSQQLLWSAPSCSPSRTRSRELARDLAALGVVMVSGLARGIDGEHHRGALGRTLTVAVLGCGIDRDYPRPTRGWRAASPEAA